MKMNKQIDVRDLKKLLSIKASRQSIVEFFYKKLQWFAMFLILSVTLFLVFLWYGYIFNPQWNETRINEYTRTKQNKSTVVFNRENFEKITQETKLRSEEFNRVLDNSGDIFGLNKKVETEETEEVKDMEEIKE